mgnify:CR=1 FL=1
MNKRHQVDILNERCRHLIAYATSVSSGGKNNVL